MKFVAIILFAWHVLSIPVPSGIAEQEQQLTDGNVKRWVYEKTTPVLGTECKTHYLSFELKEHRYQKTPCKGSGGRDMLGDIAENTGTWKITENADGEYEITMGVNVYFMKIYWKDETKFLRLRTKSISISSSTDDQIYHEE